MNVFIVFTHPCGASGDSFTASILKSFVAGLNLAGHTYEISDLYMDGFVTDMSAEEYEREAFYIRSRAVPPDVAAEQDKLRRADAVVFIYPVFWTEAPAKLVGWFDRVWTVGFAYEECVMPRFKKALFLVSAGHTAQELEASGMAQAMRSVMLGDRIANRAAMAELHIFGGMSRGQDSRDALMQGHLASVRQLACSL